MIGVVVIGHAHAASGLLAAARHVVGEAPLARALDIDESMDIEAIRTALDARLRECDTGDGVLVLADMFGGTPCNVAIERLEPGRIEVVTGANAPMLVKALNARAREHDVGRLAKAVCASGASYIKRAAELLDEQAGPGERAA
ncbi:MAG: PTS system fructose subfamily IIA component [Mariprofundaceae bacterium]